MTSAKNLRIFLGGVQMHIEAQGFTLNIFSKTKRITRNNILTPNYFFDLEKFVTVVEFFNQEKKKNLAIIFRMFLKQMKIVEN